METEQLNLKKTDDGIVVVTEETVITETPFNADEIRRQISEHETILAKLNAQLAEVVKFESSDATEVTVNMAISTPQEI